MLLLPGSLLESREKAERNKCLSKLTQLLTAPDTPCITLVQFIKFTTLINILLIRCFFHSFRLCFPLLLSLTERYKERPFRIDGGKKVFDFFSTPPGNNPEKSGSIEGMF